MPAAVNSTQLLAQSEHLTLGIYLVSTGLLGWLMNGIGIAAFWRFPRVLCTASAIPELALLLCDFGVASLHPFSGFSALRNKWAWGHYGCQMYSFFGFFFGNLQCMVVPFIMFDRYIVSCKMNSMGTFRTKGSYGKIMLGLLAMTFFWAVTPIIGWGGYSETPVQVACTIDWTRDDTSYVSYITALTICVYVAPLIIAWVFTSLILSAHSQGHTNEIHWASNYSIATVSYGCMLTTYIAFSAYAITCIIPLITHYTNIPKLINILPPPCGKLAGLINPIFYIRMNPQLWNCVKKMFGCQYDPEQVKPAVDEKIWLQTPRGRDNEGAGESSVVVAEEPVAVVRLPKGRPDRVEHQRSVSFHRF